jgi:hypothetical protein
MRLYGIDASLRMANVYDRARTRTARSAVAIFCGAAAADLPRASATGARR